MERVLKWFRGICLLSNIKIIGSYIQIVFCVHKNALFQRKISLILFFGDLGEHLMRMRNFGESIFLFLGKWGMKISWEPRGMGTTGSPLQILIFIPYSCYVFMQSQPLFLSICTWFLTFSSWTWYYCYVHTYLEISNMKLWKYSLFQFWILNFAGYSRQKYLVQTRIEIKFITTWFLFKFEIN